MIAATLPPITSALSFASSDAASPTGAAPFDALLASLAMPEPAPAIMLPTLPLAAPLPGPIAFGSDAPVANIPAEEPSSPDDDAGTSEDAAEALPAGAATPLAPLAIVSSPRQPPAADRARRGTEAISSLRMANAAAAAPARPAQLQPTPATDRMTAADPPAAGRAVPKDEIRPDPAAAGAAIPASPALASRDTGAIPARSGASLPRAPLVSATVPTGAPATADVARAATGSPSLAPGAPTAPAPVASPRPISTTPVTAAPPPRPTLLAQAESAPAVPNTIATVEPISAPPVTAPPAAAPIADDVVAGPTALDDPRVVPIASPVLAAPPAAAPPPPAADTIAPDGPGVPVQIDPATPYAAPRVTPRNAPAPMPSSAEVDPARTPPSRSAARGTGDISTDAPARRRAIAATTLPVGLGEAKIPVVASPATTRAARTEAMPVPSSAPADAPSLDLDAIFPLAGDAPLNVAFTRPATIVAMQPVVPVSPILPEARIDPAAADLPAGDDAAPTIPPIQTAAPMILPSQPVPVAAAAPASVVASAPGEVSIRHHLDVAHDGAWLDRLARDIAASADHESRMRFQLNPERLGALHVEIAPGHDGASVRFTADSEAARALIADAQPRLLAEARAQGMRIADTQVDLSNQNGQGGSSANAFAQQQQNQSAAQRGPAHDRPATAMTRPAPAGPAERSAARAERYA